MFTDPSATVSSPVSPLRDKFDPSQGHVWRTFPHPGDLIARVVSLYLVVGPPPKGVCGYPHKRKAGESNPEDLLGLHS